MGFFNPFATARRLRQIGLMGIGQRNAEFVLTYNRRRFYPRVDDKLITKKMALKAGLPVPDKQVKKIIVMGRAFDDSKPEEYVKSFKISKLSV